MLAQLKKRFCVALLALMSQLLWAQTPSLSAEQVNAVAWSEEQIQARIRELEAERAVRLALMAPDEQLTLLADPQTWLIALSVMLAISFICLSWLLWQMRRVRRQQWQVSMVMDWDSGRGNPAPQHKPNALPLANQTDDYLEYETVMIADLAQENNDDITDDGPLQDAIQVEEHSDPIAHAEFWMALKKPEIAIEILEAVCEKDQTPKSSMILFELYRQTQRRAQFEDLKRRFRLAFNAKVPDWEEIVDYQPGMRLKDMPELMRRINEVLHKRGVHHFLRNLLVDNRGGTRQGFEYGVYCDLVSLFETLQAGKPVVNCESIFA
ncbi:MAG: hypothetical protein RL748_3478 [Pseudomonadota bacterium]